MKTLMTLGMIATLLMLGGCSEEKKAAEADKRDHVLRQPIDVMNDAKSAVDTINQRTKAQEEEAKEVAGH
jgi:hypothetical protein